MSRDAWSLLLLKFITTARESRTYESDSPELTFLHSIASLAVDSYEALAERRHRRLMKYMITGETDPEAEEHAEVSCQCGKSIAMNVMSSESRFVSPAQACQVLGVCHETLRRWSKEGKIRHVSGGPNTTRRYDLSSVIKSTPTEPEEASNTGRVDVIYAR
eukprot:445565-Rhodomonas_salina.1